MVEFILIKLTQVLSILDHKNRPIDAPAVMLRLSETDLNHGSPHANVKGNSCSPLPFDIAIDRPQPIALDAS